VSKLNDSDSDKTWDYYEKIQQALNGLYEILALNFDENSMYYKCGLDNLEALKDALIDLLSNDYTPKEIKLKLREIEFNMKKCLFFDSSEESQKSDQKSDQKK